MEKTLILIPKNIIKKSITKKNQFKKRKKIKDTTIQLKIGTGMKLQTKYKNKFENWRKNFQGEEMLLPMKLKLLYIITEHQG